MFGEDLSILGIISLNVTLFIKACGLYLIFNFFFKNIIHYFEDGKVVIGIIIMLIMPFAFYMFNFMSSFVGSITGNNYIWGFII